MQSLWREILADLRSGNKGNTRSILVRLLGNRGFHALLAYRVAHRLSGTALSFIGFAVSRMCLIAYGIDIDPRAKIAGGIVIYHGIGIVVGRGVTIESNVVLFHGVTLGNRFSGEGDGFPYVESGVIIGTGAVLLGPIRIGASSFIGANTVVAQDVPPASVIRPAPYIRSPINRARRSDVSG